LDTLNLAKYYRELEQQKEEVLKRRARINAWIDRLMDSGCPPWMRDFAEEGRNPPPVDVGWFPEVEWTPAIIVSQDLHQSPFVPALWRLSVIRSFL
jgi:hypothetical protein